MSDVTTSATQSRIQNPLILTVIPLLILFAAAVVLFRMSVDDMAGTDKYWEIFVPAVAMLSLFSGWHQCQMLGQDRIWYVLRQFIHWGAVMAVLYLFHVAGFRELLNDQQYTVILLGIDNPASHPVTVVGVFGVIGFILSLGVHWLIPRDRSARKADRSKQKPPATGQTRPAPSSSSQPSSSTSAATPAGAA